MIKKINPPKFKIGRHRLNEYELRNLMLEVAEGNNTFFINAKVTDEYGNSAYIRENGTLELTGDRFPGLAIVTDISMKHMKIKLQSEPFIKSI